MRVIEAEQRISDLEDNQANSLTCLASVESSLQKTLEHVEELENRSWRQNIRIVGLKGGKKGSDPTAFFETWIPATLNMNAKDGRIKLERAHRTGPLRNEDFLVGVQKKRAETAEARIRLREAGFIYAFIYPATIRVFNAAGKDTYLSTPAESDWGYGKEYTVVCVSFARTLLTDSETFGGEWGAQAGVADQIASSVGEGAEQTKPVEPFSIDPAELPSPRDPLLAIKLKELDLELSQSQLLQVKTTGPPGASTPVSSSDSTSTPGSDTVSRRNLQGLLLITTVPPRPTVQISTKPTWVGWVSLPFSAPQLALRPQRAAMPANALPRPTLLRLDGNLD
ncbi:hypothetical protein DPX16_0089 [Anabarilius grahami]|uniref:LINE-1 type transposase domain-containing protein 1 n=1 Tax=Anabarilius grahami TaxID=495550 RepID=A0A3N0Z4L0_ANAGA|nr:hypothetical protein DPX16_0089 [Anabarilius grahami]